MTNRGRALKRQSGAVSGLVGTAIEHAQLFFRDRLVERQRLRLEIALRYIFGLEVAVGVLAPHQRSPIPMSYRLLQPGRDVADRQTNAPVIGTIGLRSMEQQHMMQRSLTGLQLDKDGLGLVYVHCDFLAAGQKVVLVESIF